MATREITESDIAEVAAVIDMAQRKRQPAPPVRAVEVVGDHLNAAAGADLLNATEAFVARFVAYPSEAARVAHVLWVAHTHRMETWESTPRLFFESPEPWSGKSRALEVTELVVPRPIHAVNTTSAYLFRKVSDEDGLPTILYDEIDTIFGPRAREHEDVRGMLNAGHRKGAVAGRCVVRGKVVDVEELPAYCAVAFAGLNDLPDTLQSRCIVIRMRRRSPSEVIEPFRHRVHRAAGNAIRDGLAAWAASIPAGSWPEMPDGIEDRNADVWEALLAMADAAGGDWPDRARRAALALVADSQAAPPSLGIRLLADLRVVFAEHEHLSTEAIIAALVAMDEAPWADLRGKPIEARSLARRLARYGVKPHTVRVGDRTPKGYSRDDLFDPWSRYLPAVSDVADVADSYRERPKGDPTNAVTDQGPLPLSPKGSDTSATSDTTLFDDEQGEF
jgi:hypothetical protein